MTRTMSGVLIETIVKKAIKDLKDSPERCVRNIVSTALEYSEGCFQREFFSESQAILENKQSPYYDLIKDVSTHVDSGRLLQYGMNLGYNSCTKGPGIIREQEEACGVSIPWVLFLPVREEHFLAEQNSYDALIQQGEELGIFSWSLSYDGSLCDLESLFQRHPNSAFNLFCDGNQLTPEFLDGMAAIKNVMLVPECSPETKICADQLRERELLYSVYYKYSDDTAAPILEEDLFCFAEQLHPIFTMVLPRRECSQEVKNQVAKKIADLRRGQQFKTIPYELAADTKAISRIISKKSFFAFLDPERFHGSLPEVLKEFSTEE